MDHDDDVEHLFSWLQTPELRYREFAGAREITDTLVTWQSRPNTGDTPVPPGNNAQLQEEYPPDQFPDQRDAPAAIVEEAPVPAALTPAAPPTVIPTPVTPATVAPTPVASELREAAPNPAGPFALGAGGRNTPRRPQYEEPVAPPPPVTQTPAPRQAAAPTGPPPTAPALPVSPPLTAAPTAGGLLGGAYRDNGFNGYGAQPSPAGSQSVSAESQQRSGHSLDAVFGRLAGARNRLPVPRERL